MPFLKDFCRRFMFFMWIVNKFINLFQVAEFTTKALKPVIVWNPKLFYFFKIGFKFLSPLETVPQGDIK